MIINIKKKWLIVKAIRMVQTEENRSSDRKEVRIYLKITLIRIEKLIKRFLMIV